VIGTWLDDGPRIALRPDYLARLRDLPLSEVAVFLDSMTSPASRWSTRQLEQLRAGLPGVRLVGTLWGRSQRAWVDSLGWLPDALDAMDSSTVEVDLEGDWRRSRLRGYSSMADAGRALVDRLRSVADVIEVTTFPAHTEARSSAVVTPLADRLALQVYSVRHLDSIPDPIAWDDPRYGPGHYQRTALARAAATHPTVELVAGLAAYDQRWPGVTWAAAMAAAYRGAQDAGVTHVRYWSAKWLVRLAGGRESAPALRALAGPRPPGC
jgi:hypothetical protein